MVIVKSRGPKANNNESEEVRSIAATAACTGANVFAHRAQHRSSGQQSHQPENGNKEQSQNSKSPSRRKKNRQSTGGNSKSTRPSPDQQRHAPDTSPPAHPGRRHRGSSRSQERDQRVNSSSTSSPQGGAGGTRPSPRRTKSNRSINLERPADQPSPPRNDRDKVVESPRKEPSDSKPSTSVAAGTGTAEVKSTPTTRKQKRERQFKQTHKKSNHNSLVNEQHKSSIMDASSKAPSTAAIGVTSVATSTGGVPSSPGRSPSPKKTDTKRGKKSVAGSKVGHHPVSKALAEDVADEEKESTKHEGGGGQEKQQDVSTSTSAGGNSSRTAAHAGTAKKNKMHNRKIKGSGIPGGNIPAAASQDQAVGQDQVPGSEDYRSTSANVNALPSEANSAVASGRKSRVGPKKQQKSMRSVEASSSSAGPNADRAGVERSSLQNSQPKFKADKRSRHKKRTEAAGLREGQAGGNATFVLAPPDAEVVDRGDEKENKANQEKSADKAIKGSPMKPAEGKRGKSKEFAAAKTAQGTDQGEGASTKLRDGDKHPHTSRGRREEAQDRDPVRRAKFYGKEKNVKSARNGGGAGYRKQGPKRPPRSLKQALEHGEDRPLISPITVGSAASAGVASWHKAEGSVRAAALVNDVDLHHGNHGQEPSVTNVSYPSHHAEDHKSEVDTAHSGYYQAPSPLPITNVFTNEAGAAILRSLSGPCPTYIESTASSVSSLPMPLPEGAAEQEHLMTMQPMLVQQPSDYQYMHCANPAFYPMQRQLELSNSAPVFAPADGNGCTVIPSNLEGCYYLSSPPGLAIPYDGKVPYPYPLANGAPEYQPMLEQSHRGYVHQTSQSAPGYYNYGAPSFPPPPVDGTGGVDFYGQPVTGGGHRHLNAEAKVFQPKDKSKDKSSECV